MKFNKYELFFLGGLLDVETIIGAPNPFPGYLEEDIQAAWADTVDSLFKRGVFFLNEGEVFINGEASKLIQTCGSPVAAWIKHDSPKGSYEGYLHFSNDVVIEKYKENDQFDLTFAGTPEFVVNKLAQNVYKLKTDEEFSTSLPVEVWSELSQNSSESSYEEMQKKLVNNLVSHESAEILSKALKEKTSLARFIFMKYENSGWVLQTLGFLNNSNQSLLFELDSTNKFVQISPVTQQEVQKKIKNAISIMQEV